MVQNKRRPTLNRRRGNARQVLLLLTFPLLLTAIAAALYWGWQVVWQAAPWSPQFSLHPANIEILTESPWVDEASILQQVVHEASLDDQLTILDPGLNERLSLAIEDHPWVEHVERVEKFQPPRVVVTLRYRHPVAFIKNNQPVLSEKKQLPSVCLVDRHGIRLPLDNSLVRSPAVQALAEIRGIPFRPPPPGDAWKDGRVRGGARIAEALRHDWDLFGLRAIETSMQPVVGSSESYAFTLITKPVGSGIRGCRGYRSGQNGTHCHRESIPPEGLCHRKRHRLRWTSTAPGSRTPSRCGKKIILRSPRKLFRSA